MSFNFLISLSFFSNLTFSLYRPFTFYLDLFLIILFSFMLLQIGVCPWFLYLYVCCWYIGELLIFFKLILYPAALVNLLIMYVIRTGNFWNFSCIISCHLEREIVWFLLFLCWSLQFSFLFFNPASASSTMKRSGIVDRPVSLLWILPI